MELGKLFEMQKVLDERIEKEHPREYGEDRLAKKILALQVELGELANEQRSWKFWSTDQEPRTKVYKGLNDGINEPVLNLLLEEYVDVLHFILSIGLEKGYESKTHNLYSVEGMKRSTVVSQFNYLFDKVGDFSSIRNHNNYMYILPLFIGLGEMLGFTPEEIINAYVSKNETNHSRQNNGY